MASWGNNERIVQRTQEELWRDWVRKKVEFYIWTGKWDNVTIEALNAWLANFGGEGEKYALALLNHFIYYSALDERRLCRYAITNVVFRGHLLNIDRGNSFSCADEVLSRELNDRIKETRVVPLLLEGNPTESGNAIARVYTATGLILENQVIRPDQILPCIYQGSCKRFLFVDDFLGSGDQLASFWNEPSILLSAGGGKVALANISKQHTNVSFEYIALVATACGLQNVEQKTLGLKVHFCEQLSDEYGAFSPNSIFFDKSEDREACKVYLETLCQARHIHARGYHGLDFAIAFHHGTPDSCLPIFWEKSDTWTPLFQPRM